VVPEVIERGHLDEGAEKVLGPLMHLADPLSARLFAGLVLALKPQEAELGVLRQTRDAQAGLQQTLACGRDGLRERSDVTSGLVTLRGREKESKEKRSGFHRKRKRQADD